MESRIPRENFTGGRTLAPPPRPSARRKKKRPAIVDPYDRGTRQTRRRQTKVRESTLARLDRDGHLPPPLKRAIREIQNIFISLARSQSIRPSANERVDCGSKPGETPEWLEIAEKDHYRPWELKASQSKDPMVAIVIDVVVFNCSLSELDHIKYKKRKGYARGILIKGLSLYAEIAKWTKGTNR
jgi:hypothetical protein